MHGIRRELKEIQAILEDYIISSDVLGYNIISMSLHVYIVIRFLWLIKPRVYFFNVNGKNGRV